MSKEFLLSISTPERAFYEEPVEMVVLPAFDGEVGVMAGHEKMVDVLVSGIIRIRKDDKWRMAATSEGFAMLYGDRAVVLVQSIEWADEIDEDRAKVALEQAEERLKVPKLPHKDWTLAHSARDRALARLKLLRKKRGIQENEENQ